MSDAMYFCGLARAQRLSPPPIIPSKISPVRGDFQGRAVQQLDAAPTPPIPMRLGQHATATSIKNAH